MIFQFFFFHLTADHSEGFILISSSSPSEPPNLITSLFAFSLWSHLQYLWYLVAFVMQSLLLLRYETTTNCSIFYLPMRVHAIRIGFIWCYPWQNWIPLLGFGTTVIFLKSCHWGQKIILNITHTSKLQKLGDVGRWERRPFVTYFPIHLGKVNVGHEYENNLAVNDSCLFVIKCYVGLNVDFSSMKFSLRFKAFTL